MLLMLVKVLAGKFVTTVTSREVYDEKTVTCLESLFFSLTFNWIRLDSQLRCLKDLPMSVHSTHWCRRIEVFPVWGGGLGRVLLLFRTLDQRKDQDWTGHPVGGSRVPVGSSSSKKL